MQWAARRPRAAARRHRPGARAGVAILLLHGRLALFILGNCLVLREPIRQCGRARREERRRMDEAVLRELRHQRSPGFLDAWRPAAIACFTRRWPNSMR